MMQSQWNETTALAELNWNFIGAGDKKNAINWEQNT